MRKTVCSAVYSGANPGGKGLLAFPQGNGFSACPYFKAKHFNSQEKIFCKHEKIFLGFADRFGAARRPCSGANGRLMVRREVRPAAGQTGRRRAVQGDAGRHRGMRGGKKGSPGIIFPGDEKYFLELWESPCYDWGD